MQSIAKFVALAVLGSVPLIVGCSSGPESGAADPTTEKADAQLAPEAQPGETPMETPKSKDGDDGTGASEAPPGSPGAATEDKAPEDDG